MRDPLRIPEDSVLYRGGPTAVNFDDFFVFSTIALNCRDVGRKQSRSRLQQLVAPAQRQAGGASADRFELLGQSTCAGELVRVELQLDQHRRSHASLAAVLLGNPRLENALRVEDVTLHLPGDGVNRTEVARCLERTLEGCALGAVLCENAREVVYQLWMFAWPDRKSGARQVRGEVAKVSRGLQQLDRGLNTRLDSVEDRLAAMEGRLDVIVEARLPQIEAKLIDKADRSELEAAIATERKQHREDIQKLAHLPRSG